MADFDYTSDSDSDYEDKEELEIIREVYRPEYYQKIFHSLIFNKKNFIKNFPMLYKKCPKTIKDVLYNINNIANYKIVIKILKRHYNKKKIYNLIYNFIIDTFKRDIYNFKCKKNYSDLVLNMPVYSHKFNKKTNIVKNIALDLFSGYEPKKAMYLYSQLLSDMKKKFNLIERYLCKKDYNNIILEEYSENVINKYMPVLYKNISNKLEDYYKKKYFNFSLDYNMFFKKAIIFYLKNKHINECNKIEKQIIEKYWQENLINIQTKFNNQNNLINKNIYLVLTNNLYKNLKIELFTVLIPYISQYNKYYINAKNPKLININSNNFFEILELINNNIYFCEELNIYKINIENIVIISDREYKYNTIIIKQENKIIENPKLELLKNIISRNKELKDFQQIKKIKNNNIILEFVIRIVIILIIILFIYYLI